jgi:hypothetical protein
MLSALLLNVLLAQACPDNLLASNSAKSPVLTGGVSAVDKLPVEIFGQWAIHSDLVYVSGDRDAYKETTSDMWIFSRSGDYITLTNPITTASATITVDQVINRNAQFSRRSVKPHKAETETVQLDIGNDRFSGIDTFIIQKYKKGKLISQDIVKYKLRGTKVSGSNNIFD